jgi:hypothetical protein
MNCYRAGVPDFVEQLHTAAMAMQERTRRGYHPNILTAPVYHSTPSEADDKSNLLPNMQQQQPRQQFL